MRPFTKRLHDAKLTLEDVAFVANVSFSRLQEYAKGRARLTADELARVDLAIAHRPVIYTLWRREVERAAGGVTITTGPDGVMKVAAEAV